KPHISLGNLTLHSPSSIMGTPFDLSPRFEYPFPPNVDPAEHTLPATMPTMPTFSSSLVSFPASFLSVPLPQLPMPSTRADRNHSHTHMRMQTRDPPMPPGLAKKGRAPASSITSSRTQRPRCEST
ncbi:hypothetical protein BKA93DRAFT_696870, partial [Sparassis latifolia]